MIHPRDVIARSRQDGLLTFDHTVPTRLERGIARRRYLEDCHRTTFWPRLCRNLLSRRVVWPEDMVREYRVVVKSFLRDFHLEGRSSPDPVDRHRNRRGSVPWTKISQDEQVEGLGDEPELLILGRGHT